MQYKILFFLALIISLSSFSYDVRLAWDANTDDETTGYRLFHRTASGTYNYLNPSSEVNGINTTTASISNLVLGTDYCFVARAFGGDNLESENSHEVCTTDEILPPSNFQLIALLIILTPEEIEYLNSIGEDIPTSIMHYTYGSIISL